MFYVYIYFHPQTNVPFYVGKGKGDRKFHHWWCKKHHSNESLRCILQECASNNQRPIIKVIFCHDNEKIVFEYEKQIIIKYGRIDLGTGTLCNKTTGGEGFGNTGTKWSNSQRRLMEQYKLNNSIGRSYDQYDLFGNFIQCFSSSVKLKQAGFKLSQIIRIRHCANGHGFSVAGYRWTLHNQQLPNIRRGISVYQINKDTNEIIQKFITIGIASKTTHISCSDISRCIRGCQQTAGGYCWSSIDNPKQFHNKKSKLVSQYTIDGEFIITFKSVVQASQQTNVGKDNIQRVCTNKSKTAGGFIWKYS